jgi:hypothetical protein
MDIWPQDEDYTGIFQEELQHFDFTDPTEMKAAVKFRDAELPFKVYNVPEVLAASEKWTDEYLDHNFKDKHGMKNLLQQFKPGMPKAQGYVQESANNFFAFFFKHRWDVEVFGLPPSRQNDWNFGTWANHARFAEAAPLAADQPHFYFQAGVPPEERDKPVYQWCFISRDLPSFSSPTETFFVFHPDKQKGIQCRFGERGVTAATLIPAATIAASTPSAIFCRHRKRAAVSDSLPKRKRRPFIDIPCSISDTCRDWTIPIRSCRPRNEGGWNEWRRRKLLIRY